MSPGGHAASAQTGISAKDQAGFVGVASNPAGATTSYKKVPRVWSQPCACLQLQKVENRSGVDREIKLTERGQQVAELIALGLSNRDIARRLFLSERTVEWHVEQVLNRLGFSSRTEIAAWIGRTQSGTPVRSPGRKVNGNIPAPLTSFVGRERDLTMVRDLVAANRLVTIVGPGGTGKTRLALRLAEELEPSYRDGAWLCDLAPVADPALVGDAVAQALGLSQETPDRMAAAREYLRERSALLVVDNCEHLLGGAADMSLELLGACRDLRVLATSLAPLGVLGEAVWQLQPLPQGDAVRLFVERVHAAAPGVQLDDTTQVAVNTICDRLDGLPLALELAAPRLRQLSVKELADAVPDSTTTSPGDRHGSLDALAAWGYRTLDDSERKLFRQLGVFAGWFEQDDATSVAGDGAGVEMLLNSLVEKSMVTAGRTSQGRPRYRLLEMLRAFARRRLDEAGESQETRLAHAERMVWLAERLGLNTAGSEVWVWPKVEGMVDDIRAALRTLLELRPRRAAWMAGTLRWFWRGTGRLGEGVRWNQMALEACADTCLERCWALHGHAVLLLRLGRLDEMMSWFREATNLAALPECAEMRGELLLAEALVHAGLGDLAAAEAADRLAIVELTQRGQVDRASLVLNDLATMLLIQGRAEEAHGVAERCVQDLRRIKSGRLQVALDTLAQADCFLGQVDQARARWLEAVAMSLDTGEVTAVATCLEGLAFAAGMRRRTAVALKLHGCADQLLTQASDSYVAEPLAPKVRELVGRLENQVGPQLAALLRAEGEALVIDEAIQMARSEG